MTSRQMEKQYTRGQFKAIVAETAEFLVHSRLKEYKEFAAIYPVVKRRNPELAEKLYLVFKVTDLLIKQGCELEDVDKVIVWRGEPRQIEVEARKRTAERR